MVRLFGDENNNSPDGSLRSTFTANPTSPSWKNVRKTILSLIQFFGRSRRKGNLSVSFVSDFPTEVHYTLARSDYTRKECAQCWTTKWEFQYRLEEIRYRLEKDAQRSRNDRLCRRGLEHLDLQAKELCAWHRREARHAVWGAQARQRRASAIANAYREIAQRCQKLALKKAEKDAITARRYLSVWPIRATRKATRRRKRQEQRHQTSSKTSVQSTLCPSKANQRTARDSRLLPRHRTRRHAHLLCNVGFSC
jgi:hypothetical protein